MKNLNTGDIALGVRYPFEKKSINFLYLSNKEMINTLAQSIVGVVDGVSAYKLYGMVKTDIGSGNFSFSEGAIYDSATGEIYLFDAVASIPIAIDPVLTIDTLLPAAYNPITYSDTLTYNPHEDKKISVSDGALDSADINFEDLIFTNTKTLLYNDTSVDTPVTTNSFETMKSFTLPKLSLVNVGDSFEVECNLQSNRDGANDRRVRLLIGGTSIFDFGTVVPSLEKHYFKVSVSRVTMTSVFCEVLFENLDNSQGALYITTSLTSSQRTTLTKTILDLDTLPNLIEVQGKSAGVSDDIVAKNLKVKLFPVTQ